MSRCNEVGLGSMTASQRWRKKHPERAHAQGRLSAKRWRERNPDRNRAQLDAWEHNNPERKRLTGALKARRWRERHPDRRVSTEWYRNNLDRARPASRIATGKRRANKNMNSGIVSRDVIETLWTKQDGLCNNLFCNADLVFEIRMYHLDHVMPLALGGKHDDSNLQLLCAGCNMRKGANHPDSGWEDPRLCQMLLTPIQNCFHAAEPSSL